MSARRLQMADELAERGRPVAGIDPKKPNQQQRVFWDTTPSHTRRADVDSPVLYLLACVIGFRPAPVRRGVFV